MSPAIAALLTLALYAAALVAVVSWQIARSGAHWKVWSLYVVERAYMGTVHHWRSNRRCPFPDGSAALIIANHRSPVDPMAVWMNHHLCSKNGCIRPISFMMAKEYYEVQQLHWLFRAMRSIPVSRDGSDVRPVREALRRLRRGGLVGVFPEGRINLGDGLLEGDPGFAYLALTAKVPVYPVFVHDSPQGRSMVEPFFTPSRIRVSYGPAIDLSKYYERRKSHETLREAADLVMRKLAELGGVDYRGVALESKL